MSYELPSIYNNPSLDSDEEEINPEIVKIKACKDMHQEDSRLSWLLLFSGLSILIMTAVPALGDLPDIDAWFTGDALWRLFDPIITLPLNIFVMTRADIMNHGGKDYWLLNERSIGWLIWSIGAGIYVQGHGIHTAAALFKHPIQDFNEAHPELVIQYPVLYEMYSNMRNLWEHDIAHYMYAGGAMMMSWAHLFVFKNQVHGPLSRSTKIIWSIGIFFYGLLLAAVAIDFPYGTIVGFIYAGVMIIVCVLMILLNRLNMPRGGLFTMGRRMVIQYYLMASILGLIIIIIWVCIYGFNNRKAAGI